MNTDITTDTPTAEWVPTSREYPAYLDDQVLEQTSPSSSSPDTPTQDQAASGATKNTPIDGVPNISDGLSKADLLKEAQKIGREKVFADSTYFYILHEELHKPFEGAFPDDVAEKAWNNAMNTVYADLKAKGIEMKGSVKGGIVHQMTRYDRTDFLVKVRKDTVL